MTEPAVPRRQFPVRMPVDLLDKVDERSAKVGLSRNAWLERICRWALGQPVNVRETAAIDPGAAQ